MTAEGEGLVKGFSCEVCGRGFVLLSTLELHMAIHRSKKEYECKVCGKEFYLSSAFEVHKRLHDVTKYICEYCGISFTGREDLECHIPIHFQKKFKCKDCDKEFVLRSTLLAHGVVHTGEKKRKCSMACKYVCEVCAEEFNCNAKKRSHILSVHRSSFKVHLQNCQEEHSSVLNTESHLKRCTELSNTDKKVFKCGICNQQFIELKGLTKHLRAHKAEKQRDFIAKFGKNLASSHSEEGSTSVEGDARLERPFTGARKPPSVESQHLPTTDVHQCYIKEEHDSTMTSMGFSWDNFFEVTDESSEKKESESVSLFVVDGIVKEEEVEVEIKEEVEVEEQLEFN